jgi:hypothetical protein
MCYKTSIAQHIIPASAADERIIATNGVVPHRTGISEHVVDDNHARRRRVIVASHKRVIAADGITGRRNDRRRPIRSAFPRLLIVVIKYESWEHRDASHRFPLFANLFCYFLAGRPFALSHELPR